MGWDPPKLLEGHEKKIFLQSRNSLMHVSSSRSNTTTQIDDKTHTVHIAVAARMLTC